MKTDIEQLAERGFLAEGAEGQNQNFDSEQLIATLASEKPTDRTLAARLMAIRLNSVFIEPLMAALKIDRKLYSKLEICNALVAFGDNSVPILVKHLGEIGDNQHNGVAEKPFKKDNYPLPRDIAARTLIRIGAMALPKLFDIVKNGNVRQVSEAVDAIGFINFYEAVDGCFDELINCYSAYKDEELIRWKIVRAMSGCVQASGFLQELQKVETHPMIKQEIDRSLRLGQRHVI